MGKPRKVEMTIGLEMDATLLPGRPDTVRLPVDPTVGATIYVQPVGADLETPVDLSLTVTPVVRGAVAGEAACRVRANHGRLPCFVRAGDYAEIEVRLQNHGARKVAVLVFVSGDKTSVAAALAAQ
ncbi:MAG: hypothetical protein AAGB02_08820 [Pseudomonadota bacterium]